MTTTSNSGVLILGIGNTLLGDEGVGCLTAQALNAQVLPAGIRCVDGGTGGLHLLGEFEGASEVVMIDAVVNEKPAGSLTRLTPKYSLDYPRTLVAHDIGLKDLLDALHLTERAPRVTLFAVSIDFPKGVTEQLSPEIAAAVPAVAEAVLAHARRALESIEQVPAAG